MSDHLTPDQKDALAELYNIGLGRAAAILNDMLSMHVTMSLPEISLSTIEDIGWELGGLSRDYSSVRMAFQGTFAGNAVVCFPSEQMTNLIGALLNTDIQEEIAAATESALNEVGNIILNGVTGSLTNILGGSLDYLLPQYERGSAREILNKVALAGGATSLLARSVLKVEKLEIEVGIVVIHSNQSLSYLLSAVERMMRAS